MGPSGSGKSTLARAIAGLVPHEFPGDWRGSLRVGDQPVPALRSAVVPVVGILFQDPGSQLVMDRAGDDVAFGLENRAWSLASMRRRVTEALADVGLEGFARRHSVRLSGGEQQRLALAGVLAPNPPVLVLDEPTANLDPAGTAALYERIAALAKARSTTTVLVEHRVDLAWPLADLVLALGSDGSPIDLGSPQSVLERSAARLAEAGIWLPSERSARSARRRVRPTPVLDRAPVLGLVEARYGYEVGVPALRDANLAIGPGERVALVGPNGSGKTTLLRLGVGLLRPEAGRVALDGRDPRRLAGRDLARLVGYVVQDPELGFMADTVAAETLLGLGPGDRERAAGLAARLDLPLERFGDRSPYQLSGGEQRRLSLVVALARQPRLLALDEPTFGQDRHGHAALVAALDELVGEGTAFVAATHDERFVAAAADRRVTLDEGWIVADEPVPAGRGGRSR